MFQRNILSSSSGGLVQVDAEVIWRNTVVSYIGQFEGDLRCPRTLLFPGFVSKIFGNNV
jgi:hypothetical protein